MTTTRVVLIVMIAVVLVVGLVLLWNFTGESEVYRPPPPQGLSSRS